MAGLHQQALEHFPVMAARCEACAVVEHEFVLAMEERVHFFDSIRVYQARAVDAQEAVRL